MGQTLKDRQEDRIGKAKSVFLQCIKSQRVTDTAKARSDWMYQYLDGNIYVYIGKKSNIVQRTYVIIIS